MKKFILLLWLCVNLAHADDWGTLFFSAEQRASVKGKSVASVASAVELASEPQSHHYNGLLQTPRQKTHWVDGQIVPAPAQGKPGEQIILR